MARIWKYVQSLCADLQKASCVQKLSLHFMENEYAAWSDDDYSEETWATLLGMQTEYLTWSIYMKDEVEPSYEIDRQFDDISDVLDLFKLLKNVKMAQIHLPLSLAEDVSLQEERKDTEEAMMQTISVDDRHQKLVIDSIEKEMAFNKEFVERFTGTRSQMRLDRLCGGEGFFMLKHHFDIFEKVWPHRDCDDKLYQRPSRYIGLEGMQNDYIEWEDPYSWGSACW